MSQPVLVKVYGNVTPCSDTAFAALKAACSSAIGEDGDEAVASRLGEMARLAFEGLYFPVDDVAAVLEKLAADGAFGKMDVLDLENWSMTRFILADGHLDKRLAPLNAVLDYSGH